MCWKIFCSSVVRCVRESMALIERGTAILIVPLLATAGACWAGWPAGFTAGAATVVAAGAGAPVAGAGAVVGALATGVAAGALGVEGAQAGSSISPETE